ncbi:MAG: FAD-dependent oxidoreductase [Puniceicoccaceae bacterium]
MPSDESTDLTIIGGGITGLTAAYLASSKGKRVRVLEGSSNFGGLLSTFEIGGNRLEHYYHHFFTHDAEILWLLKELELEKHLIFHPSTMGVFRNGQVFPFNGPRDLIGFKPLNWPDKFRFAASSYYLGRLASPGGGEAVSAQSWLHRWAGKGSAEAIWNPMLQIKFGPYADQVPLRWMIGRLRQRMASRKSAGEERLGYLEGSLGRLLDTLLDKLRQNGVELVADAPVLSMQIVNGSLKGVTTPKGSFSSHAFLSTIPTNRLAPLLEQERPDYARQLAGIEYFGAVCTILEMDRPLVPVYWLNVADPGFPFGGVIEQTNFIGPENYGGSHIAYLSRYFSKQEEIARLSKAELEALMLAELPRLSPEFSPSHLKSVHVFRTETAATVCDLNFATRVPQCQSPVGGLFIASMAHIYPDERSVNNSIRVASEALKVMKIDAPEVPANRSLSAQIGF